MSQSIQRVLDEVRPIAELFIAEGFAVYLVGGIVRDLEMGAHLDELDFDLTTPALPADIRRIIDPVAEAVWSQGERFGTIGCLIDGREYEITTHRAEWYSDSSRKPDVEFGDDIEIDLSRRDFTVNAMAFRLPGGELVDPFDGLDDLRNRRLATPIAPQESFADDPLRILRAARFMARHDLVPTAELAAAASTLVGRMEIVSAERTRDELDKVLTAATPSVGLRFLADVGALAHVLRLLPPGAVEEAGYRLDSAPSDVMIRRAVLFSHMVPEDRSSQIEGLRYSNRDRATLLSLLHALDSLGEPDPWSDERVRRLVVDLGVESIEQLFTVARILGLSPDAEAGFRRLTEREDLTALEPVLGGIDVMEALGIGQGPAVGEILDALRDRRLREGPASREEELVFLSELGQSG